MAQKSLYSDIITTPTFFIDFPALVKAKHKYKEDKIPNAKLYYFATMIFPKVEMGKPTNLLPGSTAWMDILKEAASLYEKITVGTGRVFNYKGVFTDLDVPNKDGIIPSVKRPELVGCCKKEIKSISTDPVFVKDARAKLLRGKASCEEGEVSIEEAIYSGCKVRAAIQLNTYDLDGLLGVTWKLKGIQKVADSTPWGSSSHTVDPNDYCGAIDTGEDDPANYDFNDPASIF